MLYPPRLPIVLAPERSQHFAFYQHLIPQPLLFYPDLFLRRKKHFFICSHAHPHRWQNLYLFSTFCYPMSFILS